MRKQTAKLISRVLIALLLFTVISGDAFAAQKTSPSPPPHAATSQDKKAAAKKQTALERELDSAYIIWLEEVRMILSDDEVAAFLRLSTNEEREQFIEVIWQLRDPTQDTVENEFKEEHYRRIAFANERFSSGIPGWKTDRGLIYIMHGPPDEIETHAGGSYNRPHQEGGGTTSVFPFEKWRYRHISGLGSNIELEFVDRSQSGEFRMESDP
jgi:GWxTD domain-containing protein